MTHRGSFLNDCIGPAAISDCVRPQCRIAPTYHTPGSAGVSAADNDIGPALTAPTHANAKMPKVRRTRGSRMPDVKGCVRRMDNPSAAAQTPTMIKRHHSP